MPKQIYSVKDNKAGIFLPLFEASNDQVACRTLQHTMRATEIQLSLYPEDFDLYCIGTFMQEQGKFIQSKEEPRLVCGAISLVKIADKEKKNVSEM